MNPRNPPQIGEGKSVSGLDRIARGATATILRSGPESVLKLYDSWVPRWAIESELAAMSVAAAAGVRVPRPGNLFEFGDRLGFEMALVKGQDGMERLMESVDQIRAQAEALAQLQAALHQAKAGGLGTVKQRLALKIDRAEGLAEEDRTRALELLARLPDGNALLHGDFHPGNVMWSRDGPWIIDWIDAGQGDPVADVARSLVLFGEGASEDVHRSQYRAAYRDAYQRASGSSLAHLDDWLTVNRAARLFEPAEPDREALLNLVRAGLNR